VDQLLHSLRRDGVVDIACAEDDSAAEGRYEPEALIADVTRDRLQKKVYASATGSLCHLFRPAPLPVIDRPP